MSGSGRTGSSRGSIAILALWVLVMLSILAIGLSQAVRQKIHTAEHFRMRAGLRLAGEAAAKKVIADIQNSPLTQGSIATGKEWYAGILGQTLSFSQAGAEVNFVIEDENSKININKANIFVLTNLFEDVARLGSEEAARLADEIVDFRDEDDYVTGDAQNGGSERGAYRQAGLKNGPKNRDFEFIEELQQVKGMTKEIYSFVENYITIYGDGPVNVNTCKAETLYALGLLPSLADKIISVRDGKSAGTGGFFPEVTKIKTIVAGYYTLSKQEEESLDHAIEQNELTVVSDVFRIKGITRIPRTDASGRFMCVYVTRDGIRYWVQA